jgi:ubiquinone biosynthesis protein
MSREQRIRSAITELGPTFIKLGQVLSSRPDLVGVKLASELQTLQTNVTPDPANVVFETLTKELGVRFGTELIEVSPEPLAAASIGQVHAGKLRDGTPVVVKVQRNAIDQIVHQDLEILSGLAQLADRVPTLSAWGPSRLVEQIAPILKRELDFNRERMNMESFAELFKNQQDVQVPSPVSELCTRRVLVMDRLIGHPLSDPWKDKSSQSAWGLKLAKLYSEMIFTHGVFHADPHPGNLIRLEDGRLGILDFGMVGRIDERLRDQMERMLMAVSSGDTQLLTRLVRRVGRAPGTLDESRLSVDVADYLAIYGKQPLESFDLLGALNELSEILYRHKIQLPNQAALLLKMLVSLEGTLRGLDAGFSTLEAMESSVRRALLRRMSPLRRARQLRRLIMEGEFLIDTLPDQLVGALEQIRTGQLAAHLEVRWLGPSVNRLVMGMVGSSLILGASVMMSTRTPPLLFAETLSTPGLICMTLGFMIVGRLVRAIGLRGHLDRD